MTNAQTIALRLSKVRQRLNEIASLEDDTFTDEVRNEADALQTEFGNLETRHRSALIAEGETEARRSGEFAGEGDAENRERAKLLSETRLCDYMGPASHGSGIEGRSRELNAALGVPVAGREGGPAVPWELLEFRAFTETAANDGPESQRPILQRLFGPGIMDAVGCRIDAVPVGRSEWPLITGGVAPAQVKEGTAAAAAVTAVFSTANLHGKKLTGRYEYTHEAAAAVPDLEGALRRDLADSIKASMSHDIVNGSTPNTQNPHRVEGFIAELGAATDLSTAEAAASDYGRLHSLGVDAIHASMETEVTSVIGDETYKHAAGVYITGSGESGSELLRRRSGGCMASTYIPAKAGMKQSAILHASGPNGGAMRGDSVAAIWPTLEIIRDIYSQASQGVTLTWVTLWDAKVAFRASAYQHIAIHSG